MPLTLPEGYGIEGPPVDFTGKLPLAASLSHKVRWGRFIPLSGGQGAGHPPVCFLFLLREQSDPRRKCGVLPTEGFADQRLFNHRGPH